MNVFQVLGFYVICR